MLSACTLASLLTVRLHRDASCSAEQGTSHEADQKLPDNMCSSASLVYRVAREVEVASTPWGAWEARWTS